jgi:hypothetical protein
MAVHKCAHRQRPHFGNVGRLGSAPDAMQAAQGVILEPLEEVHHIQRDDLDGTVVADGRILDADPLPDRDR